MICVWHQHQKYRVKIASLAGPITFVGFSLQARAVEGLTPVGTWKIDAANDGDISAKFESCKGGTILGTFHDKQKNQMNMLRFAAIT